MTNDFQGQNENLYWSYHWTFGDKPTVLFKNPSGRTNVIYTADQLACVLAKSDKENSFIPVPRRIMQNAFDIINHSSSIAA